VLLEPVNLVCIFLPDLDGLHVGVVGKGGGLRFGHLNLHLMSQFNDFGGHDLSTHLLDRRTQAPLRVQVEHDIVGVLAFLLEDLWARQVVTLSQDFGHLVCYDSFL